MKQNFKMLKNWFSFVKPSKKYLSIAVITIAIFNACVALATIFSAKAIVALTEGDFKGAVIWLLVDLFLYAFRNFSQYIHYVSYPKLIENSFMPMQSSIIKKLFLVDKKQLNQKNLQKINNIVQNDVFSVCSYSNTFAYKLGELVELLIIFITLFATNVYVALATIAMMIINTYVISWLQGRYANWTVKVRESRDKMFLNFSKILEHKDYVNDDDVQQKLEKDYMNSCAKYMKCWRKRQPWHASMETWYWVWCKIVITLVTIFMVFLIAGNSLSLEMYLIVVPYVTNAIQSFNDLMAMFKELRNATVFLNRVKVVNNFTEKDVIKFGNNNYDDVLGQIDFIDLYCNKWEDNAKLENVNFHVKENDFVLICGGRKCGKRTIFNMLMRQIKPKKGNIYVDGISLTEYSKKAYARFVNFTTSKPHFYDGTILKELKLVNRNFDKIEEVCKQVGIYDSIMSLKNGFNSMPERLNNKDRFLLGLARCLLKNPKIVLIYETPTGISDSEQEEIKNILQSLRNEKTIIIFSAKDDMADICNKIVEMKDGTVENITFNNVREEIENV